MPLPTTLPLMMLVGAIVRLLPPPPPPTEVSWIAGAPTDVIVPALNMLVLSNAKIPPVMVPPTLLVMAPLFVEIAAPPRPPLTVPEFTRVTVLPSIPVPPKPVPEMAPKLVTLRIGVNDPETPKPSAVIMPDA